MTSYETYVAIMLVTRLLMALGILITFFTMPIQIKTKMFEGSGRSWTAALLGFIAIFLISGTTYTYAAFQAENKVNYAIAMEYETFLDGNKVDPHTVNAQAYNIKIDDFNRTMLLSTK